MPVYEDDFGQRVLLNAGKGKAPGACQPRHGIGLSVLDVRPEREVKLREPELGKSHMHTGSVYALEDMSSRRLRGAVYDVQGKVLHTERLSSPDRRGKGIRTCDFIPLPRRQLEHIAKRTFEHTHRPTGYENPDQWEEPPVPGVRPSHPVSATGVVALERRRIFPERQHRPTGIPPPELSEAPHGSEWGGWARDGAPGRRPLQTPWDSLRPRPGAAEDTAEYRFSDARARRYPDLMYRPTAHLTSWHTHPQQDIDPVKMARVHLNTPTADTATAAAASETFRRNKALLPAAGKPSNLPNEGSAMPWYERIREAELRAVPLTAR